MSEAAIFRYFPPPQFLHPKRMGISFSDLSVKVVKFGGGASKFPVQTLLIPLEPGIVVGGVVVKPEELSKKIIEAKPKFRSDYVSFTIPDELTYTFGTSVPITSGQDVGEGVAFTIEENVPLALEDTVFDFAPISISGTQAKVVVAACVKKEVEKMIELLRVSGLEPLSCLPESQAIAQAIVPKTFEGTACIAHARDNRVAIYLVKNGTVQFSTIRSIVGQNYKQEFLDEYAKFLEYCEKYDTSEDHTIKALFVCGEFGYAKQVVAAISESSKYKEQASLANVWSNVFAIGEYMPELQYETSLSFAGSIGAAITPI